MDTTKFYFDDIKDNSITKSHLAEQSSYFLMAKEKQSKELFNLAKNSFNRILQLSRGDLETRLWLFYDAYPVKWTTSGLDAESSSIVIDSMELAYSRFVPLRI